MYLTGSGVPTDPLTAQRWFQKAADQGDVTAIYNIGMLDNLGAAGEGGPERALARVRQYAAHGSAEAQFQLCVAYSMGDDVERDFEEAAQWARLAAEQG